MLQVTFEAVKRQLELLGHNVPDAAIHAYLSDMQKGVIQPPPPNYALHVERSQRAAHSNGQPQGPREEDKGIDNLCNRFETSVNTGGTAAPRSAYPASGHNDSCTTRSNAQAEGQLLREEVMTRAQTILNEHNSSCSESVPRQEAPASERKRIRQKPHISGTLQPRATTNSDSGYPPANIAPDHSGARYNQSDSDPYNAQPSTDKPYGLPRYNSLLSDTAQPYVRDHPTSRPATAAEVEYGRGTWPEDDSASEYEYGDEYTDEVHEYRAQESSDDEHEEHRHPSGHRTAGQHQGTRATHRDVRVEDCRQRMRAGISRRAQGSTGNQRIGSGRTDSACARQTSSHYDLSSFDTDTENLDYEHEWDNVLLEATGGAQVGHRPGSSRSGAGEYFSQASEPGVDYGEAWGFRGAVRDSGTDCSLTQVPRPQHHRLRSPVVANSSYIVGKSNLSGAARPIDRVARYQQLKKGWTKDRFLNKSKGQVLGYQDAFERSHRREKVDLLHLKEANKAQRPATAGPTTKSYVPPSQKRRDKLRWNVRQRMQWQE